MQWWGKAIGAALGLFVGGPVGSVVGALLGHQLDEGLGTQLAGSATRTQELFFRTTFEVMGHLAKVDGRVTEEEVRIARRIMHAMRLSPEQVREAIDFFTAGKSPQYPLGDRLDDLYRRIGHRRDLSRAFVEIQLQAAVGGGEIAQPKRQLVWAVARSFGFTRVELAQIEASIRAQGRQSSTASVALPLETAYRVLGVEPTVTDKEVKIAYRRLMNQHHPDKLVSRGLPKSMMTIAERKTQEIRAAYERIRDHRDFK